MLKKQDVCDRWCVMKTASMANTLMGLLGNEMAGEVPCLP